MIIMLCKGWISIGIGSEIAAALQTRCWLLSPKPLFLLCSKTLFAGASLRVEFRHSTLRPQLVTKRYLPCTTG